MLLIPTMTLKFIHTKIRKSKKNRNHPERHVLLDAAVSWRGEMMTYVSLCQENVSEEGLAVFLSHLPTMLMSTMSKDLIL